MISRKITVQITVLLTDKLKDYFHRRKDDKDNGMVVAEVGLPSGFAGDISKTRATGLEHQMQSSCISKMYVNIRVTINTDIWFISF